MFRMLCLLLALGSTPVITAESPSEKKEVLGFASPHEAWEAYRHAKYERQWRKAFQCLTPNAQEHQIMGFVFIGAYLMKTQARDTAKKLNAALKNYGLDVEKIEAEVEKIESKEASARYSKQLYRGVKDRERLFEEAMTILDPVIPYPKDKDGKRVIAYGKLTKIQIDADRATGQCIRKLDEGDIFDIGGVRQTEVTTEIELRNLNGRWFVDGRGY